MASSCDSCSAVSIHKGTVACQEQIHLDFVGTDRNILGAPNEFILFASLKYEFS